MEKTVSFLVTNPNNWYEEIDLTVSFSYYSDPGRMYMSNGDPGYPSEESLDIIDVKNDSGEAVPEWVTYEVIEQELVNGGYLENDYDYEEYDESYED